MDDGLDVPGDLHHGMPVEHDQTALDADAVLAERDLQTLAAVLAAQEAGEEIGADGTVKEAEEAAKAVE